MSAGKQRQKKRAPGKLSPGLDLHVTPDGNSLDSHSVEIGFKVKQKGAWCVFKNHLSSNTCRENHLLSMSLRLMKRLTA